MATVVIACDAKDCPATRQAKPDVSAATLRAQLATVGWRSIDALDRDLCPQHAAYSYHDERPA